MLIVKQSWNFSKDGGGGGEFKQKTPFVGGIEVMLQSVVTCQSSATIFLEVSLIALLRMHFVQRTSTNQRC